MADPGDESDQPRRHRALQAKEKALIDGAELHIEPRQAQGGAGHVEEARGPAEAAERLEGPAEHDQRRRHAEGDHVREAVELGAECALAAGEPGDASVEPIEHAGDQDRPAGFVEIARHPGDDGVESGEHCAEGQNVRQQINAAPSDLPSPLRDNLLMLVDGEDAVGFVGCLFFVHTSFAASP